MIPAQQSPFVLRAVTIRGIGSYISGARLEIKPLTILCGTNGSGKSTWLKALNVLERSLAVGRLPYGFDVEDWSPHDIQLINALFHLATTEQYATAAIDDAAESRNFGPPGTIGLEFEATYDVHLPERDKEFEIDPEYSLADNLLWGGLCPAGTRFQVRIAHPSHFDDHDETPHLQDFIELRLNDDHFIRLAGPRDARQKFSPRTIRPRRSKPYVLSCSRSCVSPLGDPSPEAVQVAVIDDLLNEDFTIHSADLDDKFVGKLLKLFEKRLLQLLRSALGNYHYIGAVRQSIAVSEASELDSERRAMKRHLEKLDVGSGGEFAWALAAQAATYMMRRIDNPRFSPDEINVVKLLEALPPNCRWMPPSRKRIWERIALLRQKQFEALRQIDPLDAETVKAACAELLNGVVNDPDLFRRSDWVHHEEVYDSSGDMIGVDPRMDFEIERFSEMPGPFTPDQMRRLNYLCIIDAFDDDVFLPHRQVCSFDDYLNSWLNLLFEVGLNPARFGGETMQFGQWTLSLSKVLPKPKRPTPFLFSRNLSENNDRDVGAARLNHACFGTGHFGAVQPPRQLSAGFHQLFPILVQLGLSAEHGTIGIENPEVHLHPALQTRAVEMLVDHAASGRRIIVETHSDLVIRRTIRAILEESIPQSQTAIYFVGLGDERTIRLDPAFQSPPLVVPNQPITFSGSTLERIQMDDRGRIANWPDDFLDEDVRESRRLMEIMYGGDEPEVSEDDDEEG